MGLKSLLSLPFARQIVKKNNKWVKNAVKVQNTLFLSLIKQAKNTQFGKDHEFSEISNYSDWKNNIPIRDYEGFKLYVEHNKIMFRTMLDILVLEKCANFKYFILSNF